MPDEATTVLVVDDDDDVRSLVVLQLQFSGLTVREASTVDDGLLSLAEDPPDVVITDLDFGSDSGARIVRRCHDLGQPVVLMTASVETRNLSADLREGTTVLRKPFGMDELVATIEAVLPKDVE
jgi:DNA-binding response OmpR family regulator